MARTTTPTTAPVNITFDSNISAITSRINTNLNSISTQASNLGQSLTNIRSGGISGVTNALGGMRTALGGAVAGMSGGVIAAGAFAGGIAIAATAVIGYTAAVIQLDKANRDILEVTGRTDAGMVGTIRGISKYSNIAEKDLANVGNTMTEVFGGSIEKNLKIFEEALKRGGNANGQLVDSLKEYSVQAQQMGLNAEQTAAVLTSNAREGIFSDKGMDTLKEGNLRILEMNKSTTDALKPLKANARAEIASLRAKGDTFQAMQRISAEMSAGYLTKIEKGIILTNVFGGAGEDAGIKVAEGLNKVNLSLDEYSKRISPMSEASLELGKSWETFKNVIFKTDGTMATFITNTLNGMTKIINKMNSFEDRTSQSFQDKLINFFTFKTSDNKIFESIKSVEDRMFGLNGAKKDNPQNSLIMLAKLQQQSIIDKNKEALTVTENIASKFYEKLISDPKFKMDPKLLKLFETMGVIIEKQVKKTDDDTKPPTPPLADKAAGMGGSSVKNLTIHIEKQVGELTINTNEDPMVLKNLIQELITRAVLDLKLSV